MYVHNYMNMIVAGVVAACVPILVIVSLIRLRSERRSSKEAETLARNGDHSTALAMYLEAARAWSFCKA